MQILLFTQETCASCPEAKRGLEAYLAQAPDARGRIVDARREMKLSRRFEVMSTPWAVLVDDDGNLKAEARCMSADDFAALWARGR